MDGTEPVTGWTKTDNDNPFLTVQNTSQKQNAFPQQTFSAIFKNGSRGKTFNAIIIKKKA